MATSPAVGSFTCSVDFTCALCRIASCSTWFLICVLTCALLQHQVLLRPLWPQFPTVAFESALPATSEMVMARKPTRSQSWRRLCLMHLSLLPVSLQFQHLRRHHTRSRRHILHHHRRPRLFRLRCNLTNQPDDTLSPVLAATSLSSSFPPKTGSTLLRPRMMPLPPTNESRPRRVIQRIASLTTAWPHLLVQRVRLPSASLPSQLPSVPPSHACLPLLLHLLVLRLPLCLSRLPLFVLLLPLSLLPLLPSVVSRLIRHLSMRWRLPRQPSHL